MSRAALLLLAAGFALTFLAEPWSDESVSDLFLFRSYADLFLDGTLPYRDVAFEYPPLAHPAIAVPGLGGTGEDGYRATFAVVVLALLVVLVWLCGRIARQTGGDPRRAQLFAAATPLLCGALVRTHFDVLPVVVALGALTLLLDRREVAGFALLGIGAMAKLFPLLVAPVALAWLVAGRERRAAVRGAAALAAVCASIGLAALALSPSGAWDAVAYHLDRPVQVESVPALVLGALDAAGAESVRSVNSFRSDGLLHPASDAVTAIFAGILLAVLALLTTLAAARPGGRALALASLAAITAFASLGKVLSPQFVLWVIPLGALALAWRMHALAAAVAAAALLTLAEFPRRYFDVVAREPDALALVAARDLALLAALALAVAALRSLPGRAAGSARSPSPARPRPPRPAPR